MIERKVFVCFLLNLTVLRKSHHRILRFALMPVCARTWISRAGATTKRVCSEIRGQHRGTLLRNVRDAVLDGSLLLPVARSANLVDALSVNADDATV